MDNDLVYSFDNVKDWIKIYSYIIQLKLIMFVDINSSHRFEGDQISCCMVLSYLDPNLKSLCKNFIKLNRFNKLSTIDLTSFKINEDITEAVRSRTFSDPRWSMIHYILDQDLFMSPNHLMDLAVSYREDELLDSSAGLESDDVFDIQKDVIKSLQAMTNTGVVVYSEPGFVIFKDNIKNLARFKDQIFITASKMKIKMEFICG